MPSPAHLLIAPILIPLIAGAITLLHDERQRGLKLGVGLTSSTLQLIVAALLIDRASHGIDGEAEAAVLYLLGNWASPFGIVLVLDRLSAFMLLIPAILSLPALIYAAAGWQSGGSHFHALFQFLLMGINGAFLTGDLFNLFVFFEVMLAASYGLMLHASGRERVGAGMHYIAINLAASALFLLGVAMVYGVTGTLNMADLATRISALSASERPLLHTAAALLALAFLTKSAMWPLCFWLPPAYAAAAAPVAAIFAILTKVGVYVVMRLGLLLFGPEAGASAGFGADFVTIGGMATIVFGMFGVLSAPTLARMSGNLALISSGTALAVTGFAIGTGNMAMLGGVLYYMLASALGVSALFLLAEPMSRNQGAAATMLALTAEAAGIDGLDDEDEDERGPGLIFPGAVTLLSLCFAACVLILAAMPPLAGFIGKFAILAAILGGVGDGGISFLHWIFFALLLTSGLATLVGMARLGIQTFWASQEDVPQVLALEVAPVAILVAAAILLTVEADPAMRYADRTAAALGQNHLMRATAAFVVHPRPDPVPPEGVAPEDMTPEDMAP